MARNKKYKSSSRQKSMNKIFYAIALIVIVVVAAGIAYLALTNSAKKAPNTSVDEYSATSTKVLLHTSAGDITIELRNDKPITTANFISIVQKGWYDGTIFHRIVAGFMIQGGMITNHTVANIKDEIGNDNRNEAYTIAMANTGAANSGTSQFFINVADNGQIYKNANFDANYAVFGKVISGQSIVDTIANAPATQNPNMPNEISVPVNPVTIISATIIS
jgi:cyclophilin family peptidyl-prolyl cis-trans isomerase